MKLIAILTTTASLAEARAISKALIERRLAACAQVSKIESFYTWDDLLQNDDEYRVMIKTTENRYADVEAAIRELHSYDLPAIYAIDLARFYEPYAAWVDANSIAPKS